jgi:hypothetical protein
LPDSGALDLNRRARQDDERLWRPDASCSAPLELGAHV